MLCAMSYRRETDFYIRRCSLIFLFVVVLCLLSYISRCICQVIMNQNEQEKEVLVDVSCNTSLKQNKFV